MANYYNSQKMRQSFEAKATIIHAMKQTAKVVGAEKPDGAWNYVWGDIPKHVPSTDKIRALLAEQATDITSERKAEDVQISMPASFSSCPEAHNDALNPWKVEERDTADLESDLSHSEKNSDSDEGEALEAYLEE